MGAGRRVLPTGPACADEGGGRIGGTIGLPLLDHQVLTGAWGGLRYMGQHAPGAPHGEPDPGRRRGPPSRSRAGGPPPPAPAPAPAHRLGVITRSAPLVWLAGGVLAFAGACTLTLLLARRVVEPAQQLDAARQHFSGLYASAESRALADSLTGLGNHRAFQEELDRQLDLCRRHGHPIALVLLDLDDFAAVNGAAGFATGDLLLVEMSRVLRAEYRRSDRLFRVGGDEFAILLPHAGVEDGYQAARRLLAAAVTPRSGAVYAAGFSFSAGVTGAPELGSARAELFQ